MEYIHHYESPLGGITVASDGNSVTGLWFDGQKYDRDTLGTEYEEKDLPVFDVTDQWLDLYFHGNNPDFLPPLKMKATPFRERVWKILMTISHGQTITYGQIAGMIADETGQQMSAQAVGGAVAHNPISLLIPCHRVIGSDGSLTGYAGGIGRKIKLLQLEKAVIK